jgi:ABC-type proline/glycine betaine transport system permease subunit
VAHPAAWLDQRRGQLAAARVRRRLPGLTDALLQLLIRVERFLIAVPWWLVVLAVAVLVWHASGRSWSTAVVLAGLMVLVGSFGLWRRR